MTAPALGDLTQHELDSIAWKFLGSKFTGRSYADWPIDRRLDAYLLHHGLVNVMNDGTVYDALLQRVMSSIGPALRRAFSGSTTRNHDDSHPQDTRRLPRTAEPAGLRARPRGILAAINELLQNPDILEK